MSKEPKIRRITNQGISPGAGFIRGLTAVSVCILILSAMPVEAAKSSAPKIQILAPVEGSLVSGWVVVKGVASDADGNETIRSVAVSIDGGPMSNATGTSS